MGSPVSRLSRLALCLAAILVCLGLFPCTLHAAEKLPPKPADYFNDYAKVVSPATAQRLNSQLRDFERESSNQIVVAIFPTMDTDSSIQDYTFRIAESWKVGQGGGRNNGAVLFVFTGPRKMFIQVGYGLEGALPDITCKQIIENEIKPAFKAGNFDVGLTAGVNAMIKATRGEYKGTGTIASDKNKPDNSSNILLIIFVVVFLWIVFRNLRRGVYYSSNGRNDGGGWTFGGGSSGGGSFGGGGGGFSGGGGSFGGGGAGGDW